MGNRNVPEVRFHNFKNSWQKLKLKDIAPLQRGFDLTKSKMIAGDFPVVFSNGIGSWNLEFKVKGPGVVTGRSGSIGNVFYIEQDFWPHNTSLWVTNFHNNYPLFIFYLYKIVDLSRFGTGSGVPTLNRNDVHDYSVNIPEIDEQIKISNFTRQLEKFIELHQQELTTLKQTKQGFLQKMFPKEGETVPELRFPGFSGEWVVQCIEDLSETTFGGGTPKTTIKEYWNGNIPWIQSSDLSQQKLSGVKPNKKITEIGLENSATKIIPKQSIAIVTRVGVGKIALIEEEYSTSQDFISLSNLKINTWFAVYSLYGLLQKELHKVQGTSIKGITKKELLDKKIRIPFNKNEQTQIGKFFKQLDETIALQEQELEALKQTKQAFLQNMFV